MAKIQESTDAEEKLAEIVECQEHVDKMKLELELAKENVKAARESWEAAVAHLGGVILDKDRPLLDATMTPDNEPADTVTLHTRGKAPRVMGREEAATTIVKEVEEIFTKGKKK